MQPNTLQDSKGDADGVVCWVSLGSTQPTGGEKINLELLGFVVL